MPPNPANPGIEQPGQGAMQYPADYPDRDVRGVPTRFAADANASRSDLCVKYIMAKRKADN